MIEVYALLLYNLKIIKLSHPLHRDSQISHIVIHKTFPETMPRTGRVGFSLHSGGLPSYARKERTNDTSTTSGGETTRSASHDEFVSIYTVAFHSFATHWITYFAFSTRSFHQARNNMHQFYIKSNRYVHIAVEMIWYYTIACIALAVAVATLQEVLIVPWDARWFSAGVTVTILVLCWVWPGWFGVALD